MVAWLDKCVCGFGTRNLSLGGWVCVWGAVGFEVVVFVGT